MEEKFVYLKNGRQKQVGKKISLVKKRKTILIKINKKTENIKESIKL